MRTALVADLAATREHEIIVATDRRFRRAVPAGVEQVVTDSAKHALLASLIERVDAVWPIAPETNRCLEHLVARVEKRGKLILGSSAGVIGRASDKGRYPLRLERVGVRLPESVLLRSVTEARAAARRLGYPVVIKPRRGAGGRGVHVARDGRELRRALHELQQCQFDNSAFLGGSGGAREVVMQRYVTGAPASVSLLTNGREAVALAVNAQRLKVSTEVLYCGGRTPLEHPLTIHAAEAALRACSAFPGLRGYVGVDLVLNDAGPVVIEVNPRLTTAYLGVRAVLDENVAHLALEACLGMLPPQPVARRRVRFTASGLVAAA
jgi:predicted ATP-grasp superfamily ATP-dependent carboligase